MLYFQPDVWCFSHLIKASSLSHLKAIVEKGSRWKQTRMFFDLNMVGDQASLCRRQSFQRRNGLMYLRRSQALPLHQGRCLIALSLHQGRSLKADGGIQKEKAS